MNIEDVQQTIQVVAQSTTNSFWDEIVIGVIVSLIVAFLVWSIRNFFVNYKSLREEVAAYRRDLQKAAERDKLDKEKENVAEYAEYISGKRQTGILDVFDDLMKDDNVNPKN